MLVNSQKTNRRPGETIRPATLLACVLSVFFWELAFFVLEIESKSAIFWLRALQTITLLAFVFLFENQWVVIGLSRSTILKGLIQGLYWSMALGVITILSLFILEWDVCGADSLIANLNWLSGNTLFLITAIVLGPLAEELLFRGILLNYFLRWGVVTGLLSNVALFAGAHALIQPFGILQIVGAVLFPLLYLFERNLLVPIMVHIIGNLFIFTCLG